MGTPVSRPAQRLAVAAAVTLLAACGSSAQDGGTPAAPVDTAAILTELDSMRAAFEDAFELRDADAMAAAYTGNAVYSHPGLPPVRGRDSIRAVHLRTSVSGARLSISPTDVMVLGPDRVFEYGTSVVAFTPDGGDEPVRLPSTYAVLLVRTPEGWRIHREALSANSPPPAGE